MVVATGTEAATWQCTDNLGSAYCLSSSNDMAIKTTGSAAAPATYIAAIPQGTMITSTPLQLVVAGVSGSGSTLYVSANNNFSNFTTGPLSTDPYTEIINAPGSRITHIAYYFGKIFWWKDQSFGYLSNTASQYTVGVTIVSNQIGTLDNSSAFWNPTVYETANSFSSGAQGSSGNGNFNEPDKLGGIFFRGQDSHIYQYDGYTLTRLSRIITPTVAASNRRKSNYWTQTSQSDFASGTVVPVTQISTAVSPGDITVSSFTATENSVTQWGSGSTINTTIGSGIALAKNNSGSITNSGFESAFAGNWAETGDGSGLYSRQSSAGTGCGITPNAGSFFAYETNGPSGSLQVIDLNSNVLASGALPDVRNCVWNSVSITDAADAGKRVKIRLKTVGSATEYLTTSDSYIFGGSISFVGTTDTAGNGGFDLIQNGSSTIASGSFTSQIYNTGITSATYSFTSFTYSALTSTPTFALLTSTANPTNNWVTTLTSSGTNAIGNRYVRYVATFSVTGVDDALTAVTAVTILARSSGTYYSAVNNAPSASSWGTLAVSDFVNGGSTITYYVRASSNSFTLLSSTPAWTVQQKNSQVNLTFPALSIATTYFQLRSDFALTAATETPAISDFTLNWYEGSAADKMYVQYFQDALWFSVSNGTSTSTNNQILYLDLLNNAWLKHNITSNGFLVENGALYFGSPLTGKVYKYGGVTTDEGANIQSYWKSKDFTGDDPTVQNEYLQGDFTFAEALSTVTYTYTTDQKTSTVISIPTYDSAASIVKRGFLFANGKIGTYFNFKVGDNSNYAAWKLMLNRIHYNKLNWKPQTS